MASTEMTRFSLALDTVGARFNIYLIEGDGVVANMVLSSKGQLSAFKPETETLAGLTTHVEGAGRKLMSLEEAISETPLPSFAAFRSTDARASIIDAAYNWVMRKSVPLYDQGSIEVEDDEIIVMGEGLAADPQAARAGGSSRSRGPKAGARPKASKKLKHAWF